MNPRFYLLAISVSLLFVAASCNKDENKNPVVPSPSTAGSGTWTIDGKTYVADEVKFESNPFYFNRFQSIIMPDTSIDIMLRRPPVSGVFSVASYLQPNWQEHELADDQCYVTMNTGGAAYYRSNKPTSQTVTVTDTGGFHKLTTVNMPLYRIDNPADSVLISGYFLDNFMLPASGTSWCTVNGAPLQLHCNTRSYGSGYMWQFKQDTSANIYLSVYDKPTANGMADFSKAAAAGGGYLQLNMYDASVGKWLFYLSDDATGPNMATLTLISGGFKVSVTDLRMREMNTTNNKTLSGEFTIQL